MRPGTPIRTWAGTPEIRGVYRWFILILAVLLALGGTHTQASLAGGGNYLFQGGTPNEQQAVRDALNASSFNWSIVPGQITISIAPGQPSQAAPGRIWLDADVLDAGFFAWGIVQHEYAHQVDFQVLTDQQRSVLESALGATVWCVSDNSTLAHNLYGCERFASTVAWAYWPNSANRMAPGRIAGESGGMAPEAFRALLAGMLGPAAGTAPVTVKATVQVTHTTKRSLTQSRTPSTVKR